MQKLTTAAAMIAFGASLALAPAQAETAAGGPMQKGDKCFNFAVGNARDARFGTWGACPQAASTPTQVKPPVAQGQVAPRRPATQSSR
jgi:hypothetical protein